MNGVVRFLSLGAQDADRRVAAALAPVRTDAADRYLKSSRVVMAIDRATLRLAGCWAASRTARGLSSLRDELTGGPLAVRAQALASVLLIAVVSHLALTLIQGPRPGWFWMVIPSMVAISAGLLLAGSRSSQSAD